MDLTNAAGITENFFIPYSPDSWTKGGYKLGFNISRAFPLGKKKGEKGKHTESAEKHVEPEKTTAAQTPISETKTTATQTSSSEPTQKPIDKSKPASKKTPKDKPVSKTIPEDKPVSKTTSENKPVSKTTSEDKPVSKTTPEDKPVSKTTPEDKPVNKTTPEDKPPVSTTPPRKEIHKVIAENYAPMRSEPGSSSTLIMKLDNGSSVEVIEKVNAKWWKIKYHDETGYVSPQFLSK
jgi:uncharacterized protein YgiM (DUF1202 family)